MVPRALIVCLFACSERKASPPPPPPPPPDPPADAAVAAIDVVDAIAVIDATVFDAGLDALDPVMAKVMASPPCCCALASTEPEFETQPRLFCQQDLHGTCVASSKCPKPGSVEAQIATWWSEAASGQPQAHAGKRFVVEAFVAPDVFTGQTCGNPYVIDMPRTDDECLRLVVVHSRPPRWREGWGCKGLSGSDLAKQIVRDRVASKDRLRCGNRSNAAVFVAVDAEGMVSAFLVNKLASP